jgi:chromosome segregation ATPase
MRSHETSNVSRASYLSIGRIAIIFLLSAVLAVPSIAPALGQNQGPKRTEELIKRADRVVQSTREAQDQLRKTIDIYNSIMQGSSNELRKEFENLQKEINNTQKKREDVQKKFAEMGQEADRVFASWHQEIEAISNTQVRDLSRTRLMDTRQQYSAILMASTEAGGEVDALFATLNDHVLFLGYDLNAAGIAALSEEASKLNEQAGTLFAEIDTTVAKLNDYIQATRSQ